MPIRTFYIRTEAPISEVSQSVPGLVSITNVEDGFDVEVEGSHNTIDKVVTALAEANIAAHVEDVTPVFKVSAEFGYAALGLFLGVAVLIYLAVS